jgi:hypothetical protein
MQRFLVTCVLLSVVLLGSSFAIADSRSLEERVREAAMAVYIHGMTMEIAQQEVGPEGVPVLLELLDDPDFPRRDNVVAMLAYLGKDVDAPRLVALLDDSRISNERPEDYRARLLVPEALGRIANRGGEGARAALYGLEASVDPEEGNDGLAKMIGYGVDLADQTQEVMPEPPGHAHPVDPSAIDTNTTARRAAITYANHVDTNNPMSDFTLDNNLNAVTGLIATDNGGTEPRRPRQGRRPDHLVRRHGQQHHRLRRDPRQRYRARAHLRHLE